MFLQLTWKKLGHPEAESGENPCEESLVKEQALGVACSQHGLGKGGSNSSSSALCECAV